MLKVFCGPFSPALEDAFIGRLRELMASARAGSVPRVAVVAPSRKMADRLQRRAAVEAGLPLIGAHFHTFFSLALSVLEDSGFPERALLSDPVFFNRLMDKILDENPVLARSFGGAARPKAMARGVRSSLRDILDSGAAPAEILEHFDAALDSNDAGRRRLDELLRLAKLYEDALDSLGLLSSARLTRLAAQKAAEGSPALDSFSEILYYGFYDLTGLQADFFDAVARSRPSSLFFPYRQGHPAFRFADAFFEQKILGLAESVSHLDPCLEKTALGPALNGLFAPEAAPPAAPVPADRLRLMSAGGPRDEVWACAKEILALVESGACRWEDVGVVARGLEPYRTAIVEIFEENAIPYRLDAKEPLLRRPLAKTVWSLLRAPRRDFPARVVEDVFSSPYFRGADSRRVRRWRLLIRALGIRAGRLQWEGKLKSRVDEDFILESEDGPRVVASKEDARALWEIISGLDGIFSGAPGSWSEAARIAILTVEKFLALPENSTPSEAAELEQIRGILASLAAFDLLRERPAWDEVLDVLEEKFRSASIDPIAHGSRGVRIIDAMAARGESFAVVFLIGLREKSFPREIREDPLLGEAERAFLRHPVGCWMGLKSSGYEEERLLFYLAAASARQTLYCVYPRSDDAGRAETPSFYLLELCRASGRPWEKAVFHRRVPRSPGRKIQSREPQELSPKEMSLRLALEGQDSSAYLSAAGSGRQGKILEGSFLFARSLASWARSGPRDGLIGPPQDFLRELVRRGISPSALKSFRECPFQFFAERALGLTPIEEALDKDEVDARIKGVLYHEILENFRRGQAAGKAGSAPWGAALEKSTAAAFARRSWRTMGFYPLLWEAQKLAIAQNIRAFAAWDAEFSDAAGFNPALLEAELQAPWPGETPLALRGLCARGRLDRVDAHQTKPLFRVVDYKTRLSARVKKDKDVQLQFYALLARLAAREGKLGGGELPRLDSAALAAIEAESTDERAQVVPAETLDEERGEFWLAASRDLEEISRGRFPIRPESGSESGRGHCSWCGFSTACRKSHGASRRRAENALADAAGGTGDKK